MLLPRETVRETCEPIGAGLPTRGPVRAAQLGQLSSGSFASWKPSPIYSYAVNFTPWMFVNGVAEVSFSDEVKRRF